VNGETLAERVARLEAWRLEHMEKSLESARRTARALRDQERRLAQLERHARGRGLILEDGHRP
jgi:hypothetical protein